MKNKLILFGATKPNFYIRKILCMKLEKNCKNDLVLKIFIFIKPTYFSERKYLCIFSCFETNYKQLFL